MGLICWFIIDYISNLNIYLQVLQLLRKAPLTVRYTICQQILGMLYNSPHHVNDIAQSHGWESLFLWQLTPNQDTSTVATPVVARFESKEFGQPRNGEGEDGSSYQRIDPNMDPAKVEKMPSVAEQDEEGPNIKSEDAQDKNRIEEESSTNTKTTNENGDTVPTIAVTPDQDSSSLSVHIAGGEDQGDSGGRYRSRSSAIVHSQTQQTNRSISISTNLGNSVFGAGNKNQVQLRKDHRSNRGSLTYSKCWDDTMEESDEIWRTCNIVTETLAYILWRFTDNHTDRPPWKVG